MSISFDVLLFLPGIYPKGGKKIKARSKTDALEC
jgi:hypothetical protein